VRDKDRIISNVNEEYNNMMETYKKEILMLKSDLGDRENALHKDIEAKLARIETLQHEINLLTKNLEENTSLSAN
jgi:uncharacterized protein YoxC